MTNQKIDAGKHFDFGLTSQNYAKFRDIYPREFYERIIQKGLCVRGQKVLDIGTGTGVLPRNMAEWGADWTGTDISENQIHEAERLSREAGLEIDFRVSGAESLDFADATFDVVTACQCFWYFDYKKIAPVLHRVLKPRGKLVVLCMEWLPFEDAVAAASEELVLKYNPAWTGGGSVKEPIHIPSEMLDYFSLESHEEYDLAVPFTREKWNGRMKTCRGIGASLPPEKIAEWEAEHLALLEKIAPESFTVAHYAALAVLAAK